MNSYACLAIRNSNCEDELLRADLTRRNILKPITDNLFQSSIEPFNRNVLQLSVFEQPWDLLQESGQRTPSVVIRAGTHMPETVGEEDPKNYCREELRQQFEL